MSTDFDAETAEQRRRVRFSAVLGQPILAVLVPAVFWDSVIPRLGLVIWAFCMSIPMVLMFLSVVASDQGLRDRSDQFALGYRLSLAAAFSVLPWIEPTAAASSPHNYILSFAAIMPSAGETISAAVFSDRRRHYGLVVGLPAVSYVVAYLVNAQWALAGMVAIWTSIVARMVTAGTSVHDELKRLRDVNYHDARHDVLTGLLNRKGFIEALDQARTADQEHFVAVVDLDRFKLLNDSLGHRAGDHMLQIVASRLDGSLPTGSLVGRIGGDEFAAIIPRTVSPSVMEATLNAAMAEVCAPVEWHDKPVDIRASVGVAPLHDDLDPMDQLAEADLSMYQNKRDRQGSVTFFDGSLRDQLAERIELEARVNDAIAEKKIEFWVQPIVRSTDLHPHGVELLARWVQPDGSHLSPELFVRVAEDIGRIVELGRLALEAAADLLRDWSTDPDLSRLSVSVNVSPLHLEAGLLADIEAIVGEFEPRLGLELIETSLITVDPTEATFDELLGTGAQIIIDDFGVGYSSLGYLMSLPVTTVKVDRMFVSGIEDDPVRQTLMSAIVEMSDALGISCVAEGVETLEAIEFLRSVGVPSMQGRGICEPEPAALVGPQLKTMRAQAEARDMMRVDASAPGSGPIDDEIEQFHTRRLVKHGVRPSRVEPTGPSWIPPLIEELHTSR